MFGVKDYHADSPNHESGQYGGNKLPCQRSALSDSSCIQLFFTNNIEIICKLSELKEICAV